MIDGFVSQLQAMRDQIDAAIVHLGHAAAVLDGARSDAPAKPTRKAPKAAKGKAHGTDAIVLDAVKAGCEKLNAIAAEAKVKPYTAGESLKRLIKSGKVKRTGATVSLRYLAK